MRKLSQKVIEEIKEEFWLDTDVINSCFRSFEVKDKTFGNCFFVSCLFCKTKFNNVKFKDCVFANCNFSRSIFANTEFLRCNFINGFLSKTILIATEINNSKFVNVLLTSGKMQKEPIITNSEFLNSEIQLQGLNKKNFYKKNIIKNTRIY